MFKRLAALSVLVSLLGNTCMASLGDPMDSSQALKNAWEKWVTNIHSLPGPADKRQVMEKTLEAYSSKLKEISISRRGLLSESDEQGIQTALSNIQGWQQELNRTSDNQLDEFATWIQNQHEQAILAFLLLFGAMLFVAILMSYSIQNHNCNPQTPGRTCP